MKTCINPKCGEVLGRRRRLQLCPSCRYVAGRGVFIGGLIVGAIVALIKLVK